MTTFDHCMLFVACRCHAVNCARAPLSREPAHQPRHVHSWRARSENKEKDDVGVAR
jgi:hypothetical protein